MQTCSGTRIYVDFDDVLCETALAFTGIVREHFGREVAFDQIHSFNLWEAFSLSRDEYEHLMELGHRDAFLAGLVPIPGAREVIADWARCGFRVSIVTGRPPACEGVSREWLRQHDIAASDMVFVDKYGRNAEHDPGVTPAELGEMDFALAIEDAPAMAHYLVDHTRFPVVIFDRPWNRAFTTHEHPQSGHAVRGTGWADIAQHWRGWLRPGVIPTG